MHNIGLVFVKTNQYSEACSSFEFIMQENPNFKTGLDLITAYYALGDKEKMKKGFYKLLDCRLNVDDDDKYVATAVSQVLLGKKSFDKYFYKLRQHPIYSGRPSREYDF